MLLLTGKGLWIRRVASCEQGDLEAVVARAQAARLGHIILKVADGADASNVDPLTGRDLAAELIRRLSAAHIAIWGWHTIYGDKPAFKGAYEADYHRREAEAATVRLTALRAAGLQGYVIDTRSEYERIANRTGKAAQFVADVRAALPDLPYALSSWKSPAAHPRFPWAEFRSACALDLPQVFWIGQRGEATRQVDHAHRQFNALEPKLPFVPVGPAFSANNWRPSSKDLTDFFAKAAELDLSAASLWVWDEIGQPDFAPQWEAFAKIAWAGRAVEWTPPEPVSFSVPSAPVVEAPSTEAEITADLPVPSPAEPEAVSFGLMAEVEEPLAVPVLADSDDVPEWLSESSAEPAPEEAVAFSPAEAQQAADVITPPAEVSAPAVTFTPPPTTHLTFHPTVTRLFKALRTRQIDQALSLYAPSFTHVTADRVERAASGLGDVYHALPHHFQLSTLAVRALNGTANTVTARWTLRGLAGAEHEGTDTFHLNRAGQIVYHHSSLSLTPDQMITAQAAD